MAKKHWLETAHLFPREPRPRAEDLTVVPDFRTAGCVASTSFDTGYWVRGRPEQTTVHYAFSGFPLLCLARTQRFRQGVSKRLKRKPGQLKVVGGTWAYRLNDTTHVNALLTALHVLKEFHYRADDLVERGVIHPVYLDSYDDHSVDFVELSRVEISTAGMADRDDEEPDYAEQVIYARRAWNPLVQRVRWCVYLAVEGHYHNGECTQRRPVRYLNGTYQLQLRLECVPELLVWLRVLVDRLEDVAYSRANPSAAITSSNPDRKKRFLAATTRRRPGEITERFRSGGFSWDPAWVEPLKAELDLMISQGDDTSRWVRNDLGGGLKRREPSALPLLGFSPRYVERLLALDAGILHWLPTWGVHVHEAWNDLAALKLRYARYTTLLSTLWVMALWSLLTAAATQVRGRVEKTAPVRLHRQWWTPRRQAVLSRGPPRAGPQSSQLSNVA